MASTGTRSLSAALAARGADPGVIDLNWAKWDAEHPGGRGGSGAASQTAHNTASATAKATIKRKAAARAAARTAVRAEGPGTHGVYKGGQRIGTVRSTGSGKHFASREGSSAPSTQHGSLSDAVSHLAGKRRTASKGQRASANSAVKGFRAKSASQLKYGHSVVYGKNGQLEEHKVLSKQVKPNGHIRLTTLGPDGKRHVQNMPANTQVSMRDAGALPQVLKQGGFAGATKAGNPYGLANESGHMDPVVLGFAAPKLGSGARFRKLSATLAARGAHNPDALAAFIGRKRYGAAGMGRLSHGKSLANPDLGIYLAETAKDEQGMTITCPECNYSGPAGRFGVNGASLDTQPGELRTPAPSTGAVRDGVPLTVRGGAAHALANTGTRRSVELATGTVRRPIHGPMDVLVARGEDGRAVLRHRNGGATIAQLRRNDAGKWVATVNGRDLTPRDHQRTSLMEAVGTWNGAIRSAVSAQQPPPLQPEPVQTPLMATYGIPAMRSAGFATPVTGTSDGPRMTTAGSDGGADTSGLTAKGQAIYKKLVARGFPAARALAFARNSEKFGKAGLT